MDWTHAGALAGGALATWLGRHAVIRIRLFNGKDRRSPTSEQQEIARLSEPFYAAIERLDRSLDKLAEGIRNHNEKAGERHTDVIEKLTEIAGNTRRGP